MTLKASSPLVSIINKTVLSEIQLAEIDARYGAVVHHTDDVVSEDDTIERIAAAQVIVCNVGAPLTRRVIEACPNIQAIISAATGIDHIDADACKAHGITITSFPDYCAHALAEKALAFALMGLNRIVQASDNVKSGRWDYDRFLGRDLEEATLGVIGTGYSGSHLISLAERLGMRVLSMNSRSSEEEVDALLRTSDVISLHIPALPSTLNFIDEQKLDKMKDDVSLINISRGGVIDETAFSKFLERNPLATALLDVLCVEPPDRDNPLLSLPNVVVTPHIAWNSIRSNEKLNQELFSSIKQEAERLIAQ